MPSELDIEQRGALLAYLRHAGHIKATEEPEVRLLPGGVSNRTVWMKRPNGDTWVFKQALSKLRVSVDWYSNSERVHREAAGLRWLKELAPPGTVPLLLFEDHEHHLIAMTAVPEPHTNWKTLLLSGEVIAGHIAQFGMLLATIHMNAYMRRNEVHPVFEDRSFFRSLRLEPYYEYTASQIRPAASFLRKLIVATNERLITLVHGDYSPKNILIHQNRLVLLDHEVIHFGDPAFDLGFSLAHLLSKAHHLPQHRAAFARGASDYWRIYVQSLGDPPWLSGLEQQAVYNTLACLLARVAGRSPLEYLNETERARQQNAVVALVNSPPATIDTMISEFTAGISDLHMH